MTVINSRDLIAFVEKMPAFPKSVQQVVQLTSDDSSSAKDLVKVIETDPVMTVKILKVINSPFYGLPNKITSIQRAVIHIGLNTIKNLALSIAAIGMLKPKNKAGFNTQSFLMHSITTASICRLLAERLNVSLMELSDFFIAGLLHDFGKIVLAEFDPANYQLALNKSREQQLALNITEQEFLEIDHAQAGKLLTNFWGLDELLINAIAYHHDIDATPTDILTDCVFAANQISKQIEFGYAGNPVINEFPDRIANRFELSLNELICELGDLSTVKNEALTFIQL